MEFGKEVSAWFEEHQGHEIEFFEDVKEHRIGWQCVDCSLDEVEEKEKGK